jgi:thioredoxin-related protein
MRNPFSTPTKLVVLSLLAAGLTAVPGAPTMAKGTVKAAAAAAPAVAAAPTVLTWNSDLRSALTTAQTSRRWVLVDLFTEHCGWCKRLDRDTFSNAEVAQRLGNSFVWVKCDTDNPSTGTWVKDKYEPQGYPCILILDPYGKEKGRILGYKPPGQFIYEVAKIVKQ